MIPTDDDIINSTWNQNIACRQRTSAYRTKTTKLAPHLSANYENFIQTKSHGYISTDAAQNSCNSSLQTNLAKRQQISNHTQSHKQNQRYPLTNYPFLSRNISTMTILSTDNATKPPASKTLTAIAKSISEAVIGGKTNRQSNSIINNPTWHTVQNIKRTSAKLLNVPKVIPPPPKTIVSEYATKYCTPINIRIAYPNSSRVGSFDKRRILIALLQAFQQIDPSANIHPTLLSDELQHQEKILRHIDEIPNIAQDIDQYYEIPTTTNSDCFHARILVNSGIEYHHFKRNTHFVQWLKSEDIQLDRNRLKDTLKPHQVGFFTHLVPRIDQTLLYEHRAQIAVTPSCPPFFLQIKYVKAAYTTTKVWNVYTNAENIDKVAQELKTAYNIPEFR
jgi:hypothetical protein